MITNVIPKKLQTMQIMLNIIETVDKSHGQGGILFIGMPGVIHCHTLEMVSLAFWRSRE